MKPLHLFLMLTLTLFLISRAAADVNLWLLTDGGLLTLAVDAAAPVGAVLVTVTTGANSCACTTGSTCGVTPPLFLSIAPTGLTLPEGNWGGVGCQAKSCVTPWVGDGGDLSWPAGCPTH